MIKRKKERQKYNFQGQSSRKRRWFDLDHEWLEGSFMTFEPYFLRRMYQTKFRGDYTKAFQMFGIPMGNAKITRRVQFHPAAPLIKYHQKTSNNCCLSSLKSAFHCIKNNRAVPALVNCTEESLTLQIENCKNRIHFANAIMKTVL